LKHKYSSEVGTKTRKRRLSSRNLNRGGLQMRKFGNITKIGGMNR
jgi:hypothetical protein